LAQAVLVVQVRTRRFLIMVRPVQILFLPLLPQQAADLVQATVNLLTHQQADQAAELPLRLQTQQADQAQSIKVSMVEAKMGLIAAVAAVLVPLDNHHLVQQAMAVVVFHQVSQVRQSQEAAAAVVAFAL
jgi:hypothetical protein